MIVEVKRTRKRDAPTKVPFALKFSVSMLVIWNVLKEETEPIKVNAHKEEAVEIEAMFLNVILSKSSDDDEVEGGAVTNDPK